MTDKLRAILRELEREYGHPVQITVNAPGKRELRTVGAFAERAVTVTPIEGVGAEYHIAKWLRGTYESIKDLQELAFQITREVLPPGNQDLDAPMNIEKIHVRTYGVFARVRGTYEPDGTLKPHPGYEGYDSYNLKIAEVDLHPI